MLRKIVLLLILFLMTTVSFVFEGEAMGERQDFKSMIKEKMKTVDFSDGVSKEEAIIIAQNHLLETEWGKSCDLKSVEVFGENDSYWDKNSWHISFKLILKERLKSGLEWTVLNVDKKTGKVTSGGEGPS